MKNPFRTRTPESLEKQIKKLRQKREKKVNEPKIKKKSRTMKKLLSNIVKKSKKIKKNYELRRKNIEKSGYETDYLIKTLENIDLGLDEFEENLSNYKTKKNLYQKVMKKNDYKSFSGRSVDNEGYKNQILPNNNGNPIVIQDDVHIVKDKSKNHYSSKVEIIKKLFCDRVIVCLNLCRYLCKKEKLWAKLPATISLNKTVKQHRNPKYINSNTALLNSVSDEERLTSGQCSEIGKELFKLFNPNYFSLGKPHQKLSKYLAKKEFYKVQDFVNKVVINAISSIPGIKFSDLNDICSIDRDKCKVYAVITTSDLSESLLTRTTLAYTIYDLKNVMLDN